MPRFEVLLSDGRSVRANCDCFHALTEYLSGLKVRPDEDGEPTVLPMHVIGDRGKTSLFRCELVNDGGEEAQVIVDGHEGFCAIWMAVQEVSAEDGDESWTVTSMAEVEEPLDPEGPSFFQEDF
jgi:hypothetical protein